MAPGGSSSSSSHQGSARLGWGGNPGVSSLSVGRAPRKGPQMAGKGGRTESTPFFGSIGGIEPAGKGCGNIRAGDRREGRRKLQFLGTPARKGKDARPLRVELTQLHKRKRRRESAKAGPPESEHRRPRAHDASMQGVTRARQSTEVQSQVGGAPVSSERGTPTRQSCLSNVAVLESTSAPAIEATFAFSMSFSGDPSRPWSR